MMQLENPNSNTNTNTIPPSPIAYCDNNNNMIRQNIEKIGKLLRERTYSLPELLYKYYAFFTYFAQRIDSEGAQFNAIALFSDIYKLYKAYLIDEPYRITKITLFKLEGEGHEDAISSIAELIKFRDIFLKQFASLCPKQPFLAPIIEQVTNLSWTAKLKPLLSESHQIKSGLESKKKGESVKYSQMTILCWYRQFKGEYIVHVDTFIQYFHSIAKQLFPSLSFLNRYSNSFLKELCDPDRKYYITIMNCQELFFKLRDPSLIERLWLQTQHNKEEEAFKTSHTLLLSLTTNNTSQKIQANGQRIKYETVQREVQTKPVIFVGSSLDNDIPIKSKYVSRKQVMIIEQRREKWKEHEVPFSVVCLSQTNFTSVQYPKPFRIHIGDIFYCQNIKYQVIKLQKESVEVSNQEDERTLTLLPTERESPVKTPPINCEKIVLLILSGEDKEKELSLSSQHMHKLTEIDEKHEYRLSKQLTYEDHFYLRPGTRVLLKNANEILQNRLSRKIRLSKGMQVCLEEYSLVVQ